MEKSMILNEEDLRILSEALSIYSKDKAKQQRAPMSNEDVNRFIDKYFAGLEQGIIAALKESGVIHDLMLKTADDQNLVFPDEVQEASQIQVGTSGVKLDDGKLADGEFTMPDGRKLVIKEGVVKKIKEPTAEEIADSIRQTMKDLRAQVKALKATQVRAPFRLK